LEDFRRLPRQNERILSGLEICHFNLSFEYLDAGIIIIHGDTELRASHNGSEMRSYDFKMPFIAFFYRFSTASRIEPVQ